MIAAILDTNVIVSATISPRGASARVLDAYREGAFQLVFSTAIPRIESRHGWTKIEVEKYVHALTSNAVLYSGVAAAVSPPVRDITDTKFLALASASKADYLVTNDRRHLLRVRHHDQTRIVTPTDFLRMLR